MTAAVEAWRIRWLSPSNSRAMRRLMRRPSVRVENVSQGPELLARRLKPASLICELRGPERAALPR